MNTAYIRLNNGYGTQEIDYDLHGIVGIRLLDATAQDTAIVTRQLGPIRATVAREPDIIIRFVDQLSRSSPIRYIGLDDAGFTDDAFLVLRSKHKAQVRVQIPFDRIGQRCEIICERGLPAIPMLIAIINLTALSKGLLPLHASAFTYNGIGALATGWAKGGKTETLLAFAANGAEYVGDEWIYISRNGEEMYGIPEPIRIWDWYLDDLPQYRALMGRREQARLRGLHFMINSLERVTSSGVGRSSAPVKLMKRVTPLLRQQLYVHLQPQTLFGQSGQQRTGKLEKVFFVASHESANVTVEPTDPLEIAQRMVFSLQEERSDLLSYYRKFRFAFPEARNELIEEAEARQLELLLKILSGKQAYTVYHPYPVPIPALFEAMSPLFSEIEPAN
jgi:hypothetical protein